jgi:hypothetical protein
MSSNNAFTHPSIPWLLNIGFKQEDPLFYNNAFIFSPTLVTELSPLLSKADWCGFCIHLRSLNLGHFKIMEAIGLNIMALRSPSMA